LEGNCISNVADFWDSRLMLLCLPVGISQGEALSLIA
jgi:hypothetical protein